MIFSDCPISEDGVETVETKRKGKAKKKTEGKRMFYCPASISASKRFIRIRETNKSGVMEGKKVRWWSGTGGEREEETWITRMNRKEGRERNDVKTSKLPWLLDERLVHNRDVTFLDTQMLSWVSGINLELGVKHSTPNWKFKNCKIVSWNKNVSWFLRGMILNIVPFNTENYFYYT